MKKILILTALLISLVNAETVKGYELPPEPDKTINNSTLLGIDSNNNMLRDDVERWVVNQPWSHQLIAAGLQRMRGLQILIDDNFGSNKRKSTFNDLARSVYRSLNSRIDDNKNLRDIIYNTQERKKAYREYDMSFSGNIVSGFPSADRFSYKYADYTMKDGTLSSYKFNSDIYSFEDLIPLYSNQDGLITAYWDIEKTDIQDFKGSWGDKYCEINFGISKNGRECTIAREEYEKEIKRGLRK